MKEKTRNIILIVLEMLKQLFSNLTTKNSNKRNL